MCILVLFFSEKKLLLCICYLIHHCSLRMLLVKALVRQGIGMGMGGSKLVTCLLQVTSRSGGGTAYCPDILDFKVGAVAG